jgi:hypothetical protein
MGQAQQKNLQLHAISFGVGYASTSKSLVQGPGLTLDFATILADKHIFSFNFDLGTESKSSAKNEEFYELNLTYGRKTELGSNFLLEGHLGVGLFAYSDAIDSFIFNIPENTIGFPVRIKLLYAFSDHFAVGVHPHANFNSIANAFAAHFLFQYHF